MYLPMYPPYLSISLSLFLSISSMNLSIYSPISLFICLPMYVSIYMSLYQSIYLYMYLSIYLSAESLGSGGCMHMLHESMVLTYPLLRRTDWLQDNLNVLE